MGRVSTNSPTVSGMFYAVPLPHQSGLRPASFPGGEALVPCFRVPGLLQRPREAPKKAGSITFHESCQHPMSQIAASWLSRRESCHRR